MELQFIFTQDKAKYIVIYEQLKEKIIQQVVSPNEKLPSKRKLAEQLNVSIHTVKEAYEQLASEGFIYSAERAGYFVSPYEMEWQQPVSIQTRKTIEEDKVVYNFQSGQVDEQVFPLREWLKIYKKQLVSNYIPNADWQGDYHLREQIAAYVKKSRGVSCNVEQIYVYSGTQHQLQELCRFSGPAQTAIEEPGFKRAAAVFQQSRLPVEYVVVDEKGAAIPRSDCRMYYVTPAHQFPLGMVMPIDRKLDLVKWAEESGAYIIEDDYDAEFRYKGTPIPPLAQIDQLQRVIYFGTFSKTLIPSLRMSYMILPMELVQPFNQFNAAQKSTVSRMEQRVVAEFMKNGLYTKHIAKMRTLYRKKREKLLTCIQQMLGEEFEVIGDSAGLHIVLKLPEWLDEDQAIELAAEAGITIDPISSSYQTMTVKRFTMIGYGAIPLEKMEEAVRLLASVWKISR